MRKNRKIFESLYIAQKFAESVAGKIIERRLPGYNYVDFIYIVTW
jgi:hypothetical protein